MRGISFLIVLLISTSAWGQTNRYFISFTDKAGTPYSISEPEEFLSTRALERRVKRQAMITEIDLPVNPSYVQQLINQGFNIKYRTKWFNGVVVEATAAQIEGLNFSWISGTELIAPGPAPTLKAKASLGLPLGRIKSSTSLTQLRMLGIDSMHADGFDGTGVEIAVFDGGFSGINTAAGFEKVRTNMGQGLSWNFVSSSPEVFLRDSHGTHVVSIIGGVLSNFSGSAPDAALHFFITEDVATEYRIEEYNWVAAAEKADSAGVDIIQSSLGYSTFDDSEMDYPKTALNGETAIISQAATLAGARGIIVVSSAGNEGQNNWGTITAPADSKEVLAIGNVDENGFRSNSSSYGPTADGRIKPDLAAMGTSTVLIRPTGVKGSGSGTSYSAPLVAGLVAGLIERYPEMSTLELLDAIRKSASQAAAPDMLLGYGIPNYSAVVNYLEFQTNEMPWAVYPNPNNSGLVKIEPKNPGVVGYCHVEVYDAIGKLVSKTELSFDWLNSVRTITLPAQPGLYLVVLSSDTGNRIVRIIKE